MKVVVTGGAGFVGGNVSLGLRARHPQWDIVALDNLRRRGSELNLARLREAGVHFVHGDVREPDDLRALGDFDALVECSAEPSVLAGLDGSVDYVLHTNLVGAFNCLEACRRQDAQIVFLSTSRVYPVRHLRSLSLVEHATRFELAEQQPVTGVSSAGIAESFPLDGPRTFYGTTKLGAEQLVEEYAEAFGVRGVVDRFGVIAGPGQMGKIDQGVVAYWLLAHHFGWPLDYIGFGGSGKQVRDVLHVDDAVDLIDLQLCSPEQWAGVTVNVGGGIERSVSLLELTALCREVTGRRIDVGSIPEDRAGDVPFYATDCARLHSLSEWRATRDVGTILRDFHDWVRANERDVAAAVEGAST